MTQRKAKTASLRHENEFFREGFQHIFGIDEAGRGAWAGPVAAGVVCLPLDDQSLSKRMRGVRDSKEMTPLQREGLVETIKSTALAWGIGSATNQEIDEVGINPATKLAMKRALDAALEQVDFDPDVFFLDAVLWPQMIHIPQVSIIGGDQRSLSIAAASVLAKTWRDEVMRGYDKQYPEYGLAEHKGYGAAKHRLAIKRFGPSSIHRVSYKPVQDTTFYDE